MQLIENPDEIVIRHAPIAQWISGGILAFIFGGFCLWLLFFSGFNLRDFLTHGAVDFLEMLSVIAFIIICSLAILLEFKLISMICAPTITVIISHKTKSVDVLNRRFYGSQTKRFYFTQIQKFKSYKGKLNFSSQYFLALVLANKKVLKLKIMIGADKQNTIKLVKKLNKFVKSEITSKENIRRAAV
jgi:hypothetical protein